MIQLGLFDEVDSKVCTKCNLAKPFSEYHRLKTGKFGLNSNCKSCKNQQVKEWHKNNKEHKKEKNKEWHKNNQGDRKEYRKKWIENNKEYHKKWIENNKGYQSKYEKNRKEKDPLFKLRCNIGCLISNSIKNKGYSKNTKTANYLGCDYDTFLNHLNNNKYGFKYSEGIYDIDHIIPLSNVKTEADIFDYNYYKNLQLLPSDFNRYIKRDRVMTLEEIDTELTEWLNKKTVLN